jgi:hypothetical protein
MRKARRVKTPSKRTASKKTTGRKSASSRATGSKTTSKRASAKSRGFDRGATGFRKGAQKREQQQREYEKRKNTPFDFRLKPGDEAEVVILDTEEPFFITEHSLKLNGRWTKEVCIADQGERCPLCESLGKEGSYTMYLTVLDRRPYRIQNGPNAGKTIKASRKLLPVKGRNMAKFERQYKRHKGKWRGLKVLCHRTGDKEAAIGEDLEFSTKVKESILKKYGENGQPVNYEEIFEIPSAKELTRRHNLTADGAVGSEEFEDEDEDEYDLDKVGWDDDEDED